MDFRHAKYLAKNLKLSKESSLLLCKAKQLLEDDSVAFFQGRGLLKIFWQQFRFFYLPSKSSALLGADIEDVFGLEAYLTLFGKSHLKVSYNANLNFSR